MGQEDHWAAVKNRDPFIFKTAEEFFGELETNSETKRPTSIRFDVKDQTVDGKPHPACSHGAILRMNDDSLLLIQFMRPQVWRIRFHSTNKHPSDFTDFNTRTIIQDTLTKTIKYLDVYEGLDWQVKVEDSDQRYIVIQSVTRVNGVEETAVQLWIHRDPIKIEAVRPCKPSRSALSIPKTTNSSLRQELSLNLPPDKVGAVIWKTTVNPLYYNDYATSLSIDKSTSSKFCGFGEQGGNRFFKEGTFMNYFNFDNMRYFNVYNKGPKWDAEPLYHSDPYWIELNGNPGLQSQVSTFIDNYSQICVDLTKSDPNTVRVATRFNSFHCLIFAGDNTQSLINSFTSIVGRPRLKPRYVLGNHQGCYGYNSKDKVLASADSYWKYDFPLDGMHVDVDIQDNYRTFSVDQGRFPDVKGMFTYLREQRGLKCSTNITPFINADPAHWYGTLNEAIEKKYFVMDNRDLDPSVPHSDYVRYQQFGKGDRYVMNPSDSDPEHKQRPGYGDPYNFSEVFNKDVPFHGGVDYGGIKGRPGHYPDLNRKIVREEYWPKQYYWLLDQGLEFVWQDMTSPCMSQSYGDMKSWPFRLKLNADGWSDDPHLQEVMPQKKAIEIWSLYSYNLHKATYQGLNLAPQRQGKRNFIIGRGSFTGAHRFAGLWTGDNCSTWAFFDISVAQVLSLGLSGVTIAGADVGGFEAPMDGEEGGPKWADPELLIRWYGAYSLLPWFRNHYTKYDPRGGKYFQEPWAYKEFIEGHGQYEVPVDQHPIYQAVYPSCRYTIRLRYSLLQLLYDAMFENMMNGLPLARAMIITDSVDETLFNENQIYTRSQYLVRNDLLVAPVLIPHSWRPSRKLYLPYPDRWYALNIRPYDTTSIDNFGEALQEPVAGGKKIEFDAHISTDEAQLPYQTPMYIREGGIIPQIEVRKFVPDRTNPSQANLPANPITIHVYPGKTNTYDMYLDDGVSRASAPSSTFLSEKNHNILLTQDNKTLIRGYFGDKEAENAFTLYRITQHTEPLGMEGFDPAYVRHVTIECPQTGYAWKDIVRDVSDKFRVIFWHEPAAKNVQAASFEGVNGDATYDAVKNATVVWVPVQPQDPQKGYKVSVKFQRSSWDN